jgi:hypothetical protein
MGRDYDDAAIGMTQMSAPMALREKRDHHPDKDDRGSIRF